MIDTFDHWPQTSAAVFAFVATLLVTMTPIYLIHWWLGDTHQVNAQLPKLISRATLPIRRFTKSQVIAFLSQLGGGVLFHTIFMNLMPQIREDYVSHLKRDQSIANQVIGLFWHLSIDTMICSGFLTIFLIDQLIHRLTSCSHDHDILTTSASNVSLVNYQVIGSIRSRSDNKDDAENASTQIGKSTHANQLPTVAIDIKANFAPNRSPFRRFLDALLVMIAFGCDAVFDGITIGAQEGRVQIWTMVLGMLAHKLLLSFILSVQTYERYLMEPVVNLQKDQTTDQPVKNRILKKPIKDAMKYVWILNTFLAALTPIGIALAQCLATIDTGHGTPTIPTDKQFHMILISAFSAGSMLFVIFIEIMDKTAAREHLRGMVQLLAILMGFMLMEVMYSICQVER